MKKLVFLFSAILFTTFGMAQPQGPRNMNPEDMAKRQTEEIKEAVGLTAEQETAVYDLNLEFGKKMQTMFQENQGGDREAMHEKMTAMREEQDKKMKEILTDEQWVKYEKFHEERRARFGRGPGGQN